MRPNARIRKLLADLAEAQSDIAEAVTAEHAACAREEIRTIQHSLWLAGYAPEEVA